MTFEYYSFIGFYDASIIKPKTHTPTPTLYRFVPSILYFSPKAFTAIFPSLFEFRRSLTTIPANR